MKQRGRKGVVIGDYGEVMNEKKKQRRKKRSREGEELIAERTVRVQRDGGNWRWV